MACVGGEGHPCAGDETVAWAVNPGVMRDAWQRGAVTATEGGGMMDTEIGEAAGRIWRYLAQHEVVTLHQLQRGTTLPERLLLMGVGWLAREEKLRFVQDHRVFKLALKAQP